MNRKLVSTALAAAAVTGALLSMSVGSAHAAGWEYFDTNGDGRADVAARDLDGDGSFDDAWVDQERNGTYEVYTYMTGPWTNINHVEARVNTWTYTSSAVWMYIDADYDGRYERLTYDGNRDTTPEWQMFDSNGNGSFDDTWTAYVAPRPLTLAVPGAQLGSVYDTSVRHVAVMNQLLVLANMS
jgi:hypothetical protein